MDVGSTRRPRGPRSSCPRRPMAFSSGERRAVPSRDCRSLWVSSLTATSPTSSVLHAQRCIERTRQRHAPPRTSTGSTRAASWRGGWTTGTGEAHPQAAVDRAGPLCSRQRASSVVGRTSEKCRMSWVR